VTQTAFAAACRAAARLLLTAGPPAVQQSIDISWLPGSQHKTRSSGVQPPGGTDEHTDGRTDGRTLDRCIDSTPHAVRAMPIM